MKHITMGHLAALILGVILATSCQSPSATTTTEPPMPLNKFDDPDILRIYELADRRATDYLLPYLDDSSIRIRQETAKVFGSVQDPKALPQLIDLLHDKDHGIVDAAAWAIGQIGDSTAAPALLAALAGNGDLIGDALGKCGATKDIAEAIAMVRDLPMNGPSRTSVIKAVYRAGLRKRVPKEAQAFALASLQSSQPEERLYAAAFLGRVAESGPIMDPLALLVPMRKRDQKAVDDDIRQLLVRAFIRCSDTACNRMLQTIAGDTSDNPHVRANAFRAAGKVHDLKAAATAAVQEKNAAVAIAAAEYLAQQVDIHAGDVLKVAQTAQIWRPRAILLKHALQVAVATKDAKGIEAITADINGRMNQASLYEQGALLAALAEDRAQHAKLVEVACTASPITSIYAMEAYLNFDRRKERDHRLLIADIRSAMRTGDEGLIALCAEHISGADKSLWADITGVDFLDSALKMLTLPKDIEAYNAVLKAKAMVLGKEYLPEKLGFQNPIDWKLVQRIATGQRALIETSIGNIELQLQVEDAPGSVANFVKLVQQGFYNGKFIHRMVPAFVAQGGCPRGDGWGSTPETIRSEWAPAHYARGAVGMASAGKDTESCQWFITHCSVPHLDGRYTIFAQVKAGMEVVDALEIGDKIVRISLPGF